MIGEKFEARTSLAVTKVPVGGTLLVRAVRSEPLGVVTHWLGAASFMCPGAECPACLEAIGARWVGVLPVRVQCDGVDRRVSLLELSGGAWARCDGLLRAEGRRDALGVVFEVRRAKKRSGLVLEPVETSLAETCIA